MGRARFPNPTGRASVDTRPALVYRRIRISDGWLYHLGRTRGKHDEPLRRWTVSTDGIIRDDGELRDLLRSSRTIAVVGLSPKPDRDSYHVAAYLQAHGYRI